MADVSRCLCRVVGDVRVPRCHGFIGRGALPGDDIGKGSLVPMESGAVP